MKKTTLVVLLLFILYGCATIVNGTRQNVAINSVPSGAKIIKQGIHIGTTPAVLELSRSDSTVMLRFEKEGHEPVDVVMTRQVSGWVLGNAIFGGLIGVAIDFVDGAAFTLTPSEINMILQRQNINKTELSEGSVVVVDLSTIGSQMQK